MARSFGKTRAVVWLLCEVGAFEEALNIALTQAKDLEVAKKVAGDTRISLVSGILPLLYITESS